MSKQKKTTNKKKVILSIALITLGVAVVGGGIFAAVKLLGKDKTQVLPQTSVPSDHIVEYPDIEAYYKENSDVKDVVSVNDSSDTLSEKEVIELLEQRGFSEYEVTTEYSIDGAYNDPVTISSSSDEKHPMYDTYYVSSNGDIWSIMIIENTIIASPLSFNMEDPNRVPVVVSESDEITSYDSSTNSFYKTVPYDSTMDVRIVNKIDSTTLDSLTVEALANG